jgi:hypothetical protein
MANLTIVRRKVRPDNIQPDKIYVIESPNYDDFVDIFITDRTGDIIRRVPSIQDLEDIVDARIFDSLTVVVDDSLLSTSTQSALSSNQGRVLDGKITQVRTDYGPHDTDFADFFNSQLV